MSTNGNSTVEIKSPLLRAMLMAQWADDFPTPELQSEALHRYRDGITEITARIEAELLSGGTAPSSGLRPPSPEKGEGTATPSPFSGEGRGEGGFSLPTPHGRIGKAVKSIEKVAAWDMVGELEEWMAVKVPPYRAARRVFSWLWMAFGAEAMLATLISCVLLYGAFLGVRWTWREVRNMEAGLFIEKARTPRIRRRGTERGRRYLQRIILLPKSAFRIPPLCPMFLSSSSRPTLSATSFKWTSMGPGYTYLLYRSINGSQDPALPLNGNRPLHALGAVIDLYPNGDRDTWISVTAVDANGNETKPSEPVHFEFTAMNQNNIVEPIAEEPTTQNNAERGAGSPEGGSVHSQKPSSASRIPHPVLQQDASTNQSVPVNKPSFVSSLTQQLIKNADGTIASGLVHHPLAGQGLIASKNAAITASEQARSAEAGMQKEVPSSELRTLNSALPATIPLVTGIHADVVSPEEIHLSWDYLGPGYTYNAYTDVEYEMKKPWKENEKPLHAPGADWQPERVLDFYWLAVTAIDRNGHEGKMSEPIYVKVR